MATLPTPLRAALGLAATALDEARKLPETLPQAPVVAVSTAMQVSLRIQQRIAELAARGDEVLSQLRGTSSEPPEWATFDETPDQAASGQPNGSARGLAAFDRVPEGSAGDPGESVLDQADTGTGQPGSDQAGTDQAGSDQAGAGRGRAAGGKAPSMKTSSGKAPGSKAAGTKAAASKAAGTKAAASKATGTKAAASKSPSSKSPSSKAERVKAASKAPSVKAASKPAKPAPASEPLAEAASRAQPSDTPNPATMAAEIVQAQQSADGPTQAQQSGGGPTPARSEAGSDTE
jgi:hypothetical protein